MIEIPQRSKGSLDSSTLLSINHIDTNSILTKNNVENLNKGRSYDAPVQRTPHAVAGRGTTGSTPPGNRAAGNSVPPVNRAAENSVPPVNQAAAGSVPPVNRAAVNSASPVMGTPPEKPMPVLSHSVQKGQKVPLFSGAAMPFVTARFGWNVKRAECDIDVSTFLLSKDGKVIGDDWFVFYGQEESPDRSVRFQKVSDRSDREAVTIDLNRLNPAVEKLIFVMTINEAFEKRLNFSMVKDAYIRVTDAQGREELVSYVMNDYYPNVISMMIGELYKHNGAWKFNAVGNGVAKDLAGLCELYGVQVI